MVDHNGEMKSRLTFNAFSQRASILRDPETKEQMCTRKLCGSIFQTIPFSANLPGEDNGEWAKCGTVQFGENKQVINRKKPRDPE